jgi:hypothetical protein
MASYAEPTPGPTPLEPTPITIRLVQDPPVPAPGGDANEAGSTAGDGGPPSQGPSGKHDEFYKYWDRFLGETPDGKYPKKKKRDGDAAGKNGVVSLDADLEGRPTHLTRRNTQGVVTT